MVCIEDGMLRVGTRRFRALLQGGSVRDGSQETLSISSLLDKSGDERELARFPEKAE